MRKLLFLALCSLFLASCSPQQRLNRIIKNNPGLLQVNDTLIFRDTVTFNVPGTKFDTVVSLKNAKDTIFIHNGFVHVTTYIKGDSIYIEATTDPLTDTIYIEKKIVAPKYISQEKSKWDDLTNIIVIIICIGLALWIVFKK